MNTVYVVMEVTDFEYWKASIVGIYQCEQDAQDYLDEHQDAVIPWFAKEPHNILSIEEWEVK